MQIIKDFDHEAAIADLYSESNEFNIKFIDLKEHCEKKKMYVAIGEKVLLRQLDLKREVVLTMLNQLEKLQDGKNFFRVDSILPVGVQMRFYSTPLEELAEKDEFYKSFLSISSNRQGNYRCNLLDLADILNVKPYNIPKLLY